MSDTPFVGNVLDNPKYKDKVSVGETSGALDTALETGAHVDPMVRFHGRQGHGFAAEQANNAIDILHGKDAIIVGNDYAKNGADRLVNGQEIARMRLLRLMLLLIMANTDMSIKLLISSCNWKYQKTNMIRRLRLCASA